MVRSALIARDTITMPRQFPSSLRVVSVLPDSKLQVTFTGLEFALTLTVPLPVQLPDTPLRNAASWLNAAELSEENAKTATRPEKYFFMEWCLSLGECLAQLQVPSIVALPLGNVVDYLMHIHRGGSWICSDAPPPLRTAVWRGTNSSDGLGSM